MNAIATAVPARSWSTYQQAIFDFVENGVGNALVEAVAGSGKTTTIVEALKRVQGSSIFLAFNKAIAAELAERGVNARTFHSLCFSPVMRSTGAKAIDVNKLRRIIVDNLTDKDVQTYGAFINKMVGLARQAGVGCVIEDSEQVWLDIADHHDLEVDGGDMARGVFLARRLLQASNESPELDFDDLLYRAVLDGISLPRFDWVFVDEAQDTNAIQRAILRKLCHAGTRIVAVGDPAQAIYGFRGADSESLNLIAEEFSAVRLPLTVSYRCPGAVVEFARRWVSHIEAAPAAPAGVVSRLGEEWNGGMFEPTDLVVCRTTKPLVSLAYRMLRAGQGVRIMGREIGQGLQNLITKLNAKGVDALTAKIHAWSERESQKALSKGNDAKVAAIQDQADCILCLIESLSETDRTVPALLRLLDTLFADVRGVTTLATIHKAKGLEADRVYWLNSSQCPSKWAKKDWQVQQEHNLCYVAATRAKAELYLIEEKR